MASFEVFIRLEVLAEGHRLVNSGSGELPRIELVRGRSWRTAVEVFIGEVLGASAACLELRDLKDAAGELLPVLELTVRGYIARRSAPRDRKYRWAAAVERAAAGHPEGRLEPGREVELFTDGGSRGNPGPAAIGGVLRQTAGGFEEEFSQAIGETTNNVAEYRALVEGLKLALERGARKVILHSDSQLLVRQLEGRYKVKAPELIALHSQAKALAANLETFRAVHVPREQNAQADSLVNRALNALEKDRLAKPPSN